MSTNLTIESPDFDSIRDEAGQATTDAARTLWYALNEEMSLRRQGVQEAKDVLAPAVITDAPTSPQDNYDVNNASLLHLTGSTNAQFTGFRAPSTDESRVLFIYNSGTGTVQIFPQHANSAAENRVVTYNGGLTFIAPAGTMILLYLSDRWREVMDEGTAQPGDIIMTGRTTARAGWFLCDGDAVNRTTYVALFTAIGTSFGVGDGSTTFNVPDMRQRFPLGQAVSGTGATLGGTGGLIDHTHTWGTVSGSTAAEAAHTHASGTVSGSTAAEALHTHTAGAVSGSTAAEAAHTHAVDPPNTTTTGEDVHTHTFSVTSGNPSATSAILIGGGSVVAHAVHSHAVSGTTSAGSNNSHFVDIASFTSGVGTSHLHGAGTLAVGTSGAGSSHLHAAGTLAVGVSGAGSSHLHAAGTLAVGVSGTANPPFQVVNYMIKY